MLMHAGPSLIRACRDKPTGCTLRATDREISLFLAQAVVVQNAARSGDVPSLEAYFPRGSDQDPKHLTTKGCWPSSFLWG